AGDDVDLAAALVRSVHVEASDGVAGGVLSADAVEDLTEGDDHDLARLRPPRPRAWVYLHDAAPPHVNDLGWRPIRPHHEARALGDGVLLQRRVGHVFDVHPVATPGIDGIVAQHRARAVHLHAGDAHGGI